MFNTRSFKGLNNLDNKKARKGGYTTTIISCYLDSYWDHSPSFDWYRAIILPICSSTILCDGRSKDFQVFSFKVRTLSFNNLKWRSPLNRFMLCVWTIVLQSHYGEQVLHQQLSATLVAVTFPKSVRSREWRNYCPWLIEHDKWERISKDGQYWRLSSAHTCPYTFLCL